jgi:hypothetical protein
MYIPGWVILLIILIGGLILGHYVGKAGCDYDFVSPLIGLAIQVITVIGVGAFLLGKYVF